MYLLSVIVKNRNLVIVLFSLLLTGACKKEDAVYPYTGITRFVVKDAAGNDIKAVINNNDILLYWPPFQVVPDSVNISLSLQERAVVFPASGTKIPFKEGFVFTVTAENGTTRQYRLKPVINQPGLNILIDAPVADGVYVTQQGEAFPYIRADYLVPDSNSTRIWLVRNNGQTINMNSYVTRLVQFQLIFSIPASFDTGHYTIRITSGIHTYNSPYQLFINYPRPGINWPYTVNLTRGQTSTFTLAAGTGDTGPTKITGLQMRLVSNDTYYPVTITGSAPGSLTVQIPNDYPTGTYYYFKIFSEAYPNGHEQFMGSNSRRIKIN